MLWVTWRQHRALALVTVVVLAGAVAVLFADRMPFDVVKALPVAPVFVGLFWGVPLLAREYERGTQCLMWTQSVSRIRWLAVKLGVLGAAVTVAGLVFGMLVLDWSRTSALDPFSSEVFGATGVAAAAWFLAVFALGAASGAVLRRTLPAMAVTIAVFAGLMIGAFIARDHYAEPLAVTVGEGFALPNGALVTGSGVLDAGGNQLTWEAAGELCGDAETVSCMRERGMERQFVLYQPADRYWRFQWTETGLLLLVTVAAAGVTVRQVVNRSR